MTQMYTFVQGSGWLYQLFTQQYFFLSSDEEAATSFSILLRKKQPSEDEWADKEDDVVHENWCGFA